MFKGTNTRRRALRAALSALVLAVGLSSTAAYAQIYGDFYTPGLGTYGSGSVLGGAGLYGGYGGYGGYGYQSYGTDVMGTVSGSVRQIDFDRGHVVVDTPGGGMRINARPQDLAGLNPGDVVSLSYLSYAGEPWLAGGNYGGYGYGGGSFALAGQLTGTVQHVDRARGRLQVNGRWVRAHPEQVSGVYPGQFISVGYIQVGNTRWVDALAEGGLYGGGLYGGGLYGGGVYGGGLYGGGIYGGGLYGGGIYGPGFYGPGVYGGVPPGTEVESGATKEKRGEKGKAKAKEEQIP